MPTKHFLSTGTTIVILPAIIFTHYYFILHNVTAHILVLFRVFLCFMCFIFIYDAFFFVLPTLLLLLLFAATVAQGSLKFHIIRSYGSRQDASIIVHQTALHEMAQVLSTSNPGLLLLDLNSGVVCSCRHNAAEWTSHPHLHCTLSWTCASLRLMLSPLYGADWHRYSPIMSRLTFLSLKRPSGVSTMVFPDGISRSFSVRDQSIGGRGLPSATKHTSSALPPSRTLTTWPPGGTDSTGGETGGKARAKKEGKE